MSDWAFYAPWVHSLIKLVTVVRTSVHLISIRSQRGSRRKGHFSLMRQTKAAIDNNLFSLFWKYYALSFSLKVTRTTFYEISKISHICSIFGKSVCIRVVHTFWDRTSFVFPLFPRKGSRNSENLWMTFIRYFFKIVCIFFAYWRTAEKILLFN